MVWPILTLLALATLAAVHFWWRKKFLAARAAAEDEMARFAEAHQQAATELQGRLETLFNSMVEGLLVLDQNGRIQLANRAFANLFGITTDLRSRTIIEALRLHELSELVDAVSTQPQVLEHELKLSRPNELLLQVNAAGVFNGDGRRQGTILVFHDLTRLKKLELARREFVANVSHELRTPLSLIKGYVETLLEGAKDNPEVATKFLRTIDRNAERLKLLIEDLLTISELESGRMKLNLQVVPLHTIVDKVIADLRSRAQAKEVTLANETPGLSVRADGDRLEQVLSNLIDNAIKYGHVGGKVVVGARVVEAGQVEVQVEDDGPGIPPEALERVFERFYRVDKARSREQGGTGLGLSIVKHIVQSHGGRVWARGELGRGAAFHFTLPQDSGGLQQPLL
jgi:two-component system phosphate regulon sensor histidine kinase PhoR